jgi:molybdate transport repressor ModE-like protein
MGASRRHAYKDIRVQQLRSFCATARLGSLTAAAAALGLAQPTVWEQVHALERVFGPLIEREARGCRLTEAGRALLGMAAPLVAGFDSLPQAVSQTQKDSETWLTVAATERIFADDLPEAVAEFARQAPRVRLRFREMPHEEIEPAVESGAADLGLALGTGRVPKSAWLVFEPAYELDVLLVTPADHPLARHRLRPDDLKRYPFVNSGSCMLDCLAAGLQTLGIFNAPPCRLEMAHANVVRRYVEMGFGIGLVVGLPGRPAPSPGLHERSLSDQLGRLTVQLIRRKGALHEGAQRILAEAIRTTLRPRQRRRRIA